MRGKAGLILLFLLALVLVWWGGALVSDPEPAGPRRPEAPASADPTLVGHRPGKGDRALAPEGTGARAGAEARAEGGIAALAGPAAEPEEPKAVYTGAMPPGWAEAPPAQRPHAIRPPRPAGPSRSPGEHSGGVGPTGHWTRFGPAPPPRGTATLVVLVRDEAGTPVPGADVYLGPPASLREAAVSFGDLRSLGRTTRDGSLRIEELPAGAAALAGNFASRWNGPRGLDARSSIPILLAEHATVHAELMLPLRLDAFGALQGRVVDEKGRGVARAQVGIGFLRTFCDADGRFETPHLPAGSQRVTASRNGYTPTTLEIDVAAGGTMQVELMLRYRESGTLLLEGRVRDADGAGVEGASLYLLDDGGRGTLRSVLSTEDGVYRFEDLPDRLRTDPCRIQAGKAQEGYPTAIVPFAEGLSDTHLDIDLPPRHARVVFRLTSSRGGEPITRCRVEPTRLDAEDRPSRGFTGRRADGLFEHWFDTGRYRFVVEAPEHLPRAVEAELPRPGETVELGVVMSPAAAPGVPLTLRLRIHAVGTREPVASCLVEVLDPSTGEPVARLEGAAIDGVWSMPVPSGRWRLRVCAEGHEASEEEIELPEDPPSVEVEVRLTPH